jgi:hypothetical protein
VYVIRLKRSVWAKSRKYRAANPQYQDGKPHVYVGSTAKTPEERFETHIRGERRSSPLVRRFGKKLFEWAYRELPSYPDRESAERAEAETAEQLRWRGWGVWCRYDPVRPRRRGDG